MGKTVKLADENTCTGCAACVQICSRNAVTMKADEFGFFYPEIDRTKCSECGLCAKTCPILENKTECSENIGNNAFAAINRNDEIRMKSSSGGLFSVFAEKIIDEGGVVFGAGFDGRNKVRHSFAQTKEDLQKFYGSKYVQSDIGNTFADCRRFLDTGRKVLFSGVPCQIGGLRAFLKREYENLFCIDLICHGVPSQSLFDKYVSEKSESVPSKIAFRRKDFGWKLYSLSLTYANESEYSEIVEPVNKGDWMAAFNKGIDYRKSCYNCSFKKEKGISDITLADLWGIQTICPEMDDDRGTSLMFINSQKGLSMFNSLRDKMVLQKIDADLALKFNPAKVNSAARPAAREKFLSGCKKNSFHKMVIKYVADKFPVKIYRFCRRCAGRILKPILRRLFK